MGSGHDDRLDSWKEIAEYLRRDLATVRRWEGKRGLPVHRVPGSGRQAVFAYPAEIDAWLANGAGLDAPRQVEPGRNGQQPRDPDQPAASPQPDLGPPAQQPSVESAAQPLRPQGALTGRRVSHYRVLDLLGGGGMGVVYKAEDLKLGRRVALKFLPEELATDPVSLERLEREARAASALSHPNICTIYEFGEHEGQPFIVMELLEGQTLRDLIATSPTHVGPGLAPARPTQGSALQIDELLNLASQIVNGLEAAHQKGIIHRDIKPANVFVTNRGEAKILDFGVAKLQEPWTGDQGPGAGDPGPRAADQGSIESAGSESPTPDPRSLAPSLTRTGVKMGTAGYMSPEQVRGEKVDARTDLFSFGLVLYEMATGQQAFAGDTAAIVHEEILHRTPPSAHEVNPALPARLAAIINKALEKDRDRRYQRAADIGDDLKELQRDTDSSRALATTGLRRWAWAGVTAVVVSVALLVGLNVRGLRGRVLGPSAHPRISSLAVLPLENLSRDPDQEYFADGVTDELITDLGKIRSVRVISRTSAMQYKGTRKTLPEIARELNVDAVVEGTVQRSGNRVLISAQLIHAPSDRHLWAESYDRDLRDVLALESEVALAIATEIKAQVSPQEQVRLASARPVNPVAHELYLRGLFYADKDTPEGGKKAIQYLQRAIETDPNYALAYALLAECYDGMGEGAFRVMAREDAFPKAEAAARHALQLDPTLPLAHTALAIAKTEWDWDWQGAEREFKQAIELNPGDPEAYDQHIMLLTPMGRHQEAIVEIRKGESLNPADLGSDADVGSVLCSARLYDEGIAQELKVLEMDPGFAYAHLILGSCYTEKGLYKEALAEYKKWADLSPGGPEPAAAIGYTYARMGRRAGALKIVDQLKSEFHQGHPSVAASDLAQIYSALGDKEQALAWLETSIEKREEYPAYMKVDPALDPLRSDPRFQDLVRRMQFPE